MKTALLFSGQGAQYVGMGQDLYLKSPEARTLYEEADALLQNGFSTVCFEGPEETLTDTSYCQPALYVHGLALFAALKKERPDFSFQACAGLSLGEFTAHTVAGTFSFAEGLKLVAARGRLMQEACRATEGGMLTLIGASREQAEALASQSGLQVANYNCPGQIVLSGAKSLVPNAVEQGKALGLKRCLPLNVAGAYHSRLMQPAQDALAPLILAAPLQTPSVPVFSNVTGQVASDVATVRDTLTRQVTGSVRWEECVEGLISSGCSRLIELGPGRVLAGMVKRINKDVPCLSAGNLEELQALLPQL
ncbi:MAG: ACP S-malonyltransferase [Blastochloris sp.]|nr:ACP S-malonyltransferase [Blastochloris sp.]